MNQRRKNAGLVVGTIEGRDIEALVANLLAVNAVVQSQSFPQYRS